MTRRSLDRSTGARSGTAIGSSTARVREKARSQRTAVLTDPRRGSVHRAPERRGGARTRNRRVPSRASSTMRRAHVSSELNSGATSRLAAAARGGRQENSERSEREESAARLAPESGAHRRAARLTRERRALGRAVRGSSVGGSRVRAHGSGITRRGERSDRSRIIADRSSVIARGGRRPRVVRRGQHRSPVLRSRISGKLAKKAARPSIAAGHHLASTLLVEVRAGGRATLACGIVWRAILRGRDVGEGGRGAGERRSGKKNTDVCREPTGTKAHHLGPPGRKVRVEARSGRAHDRRVSCGTDLLAGIGICDHSFPARARSRGPYELAG
jgi:hypothetical protein